MLKTDACMFARFTRKMLIHSKRRQKTLHPALSPLGRGFSQHSKNVGKQRTDAWGHFGLLRKLGFRQWLFIGEIKKMPGWAVHGAGVGGTPRGAAPVDPNPLSFECRRGQVTCYAHVAKIFRNVLFEV